MVGMTLQEALDEYKNVYMAYRNFAERTREEYINDLEDLVEFLEKLGVNHVKEIGLSIIERYVAHLEQEGFASLTRKRKVVAIRSFLSFLYQDGYIQSNIANKVVLPFAESTTPYVLTHAECDQLRLACAASPRDRAIIELLLQTGIKLSELTGLTINDVEIKKSNIMGDQDSGFVRLIGGRGKKERMIPLNTKACIALKNYWDVRKDAGNSIFFLNRFGEPLGERGVQKMLRKYLKKSGIGRATIQALRHTFAIHHSLKGTDPKTIQEVMGYKDPRSTFIYFSMAQELMKGELEEHAL